MERINPSCVRMVNRERRVGGMGLYSDELVFTSLTDNSFLVLDIDTLKARRLSSNSKCNLGTQGIITEEDNLWLMPLNGMTLTCTDGMGVLIVMDFQCGKGDRRIWYALERKLYEVNIDTKECRAVAIEFDYGELR